MKFAIVDIMAVVHRKELPRCCPHCDTPIDAARLIQLECTAQSVDIERSGSEPELGDWGLPEGCGDDYTPLSWRCECDGELVQPGHELNIAEPDDSARFQLLEQAARHSVDRRRS